MSSNILIWLLLTVFAVGIILWLYQRTRPKPECIYCQSKNVSEISRETIGTRMIRHLNSPMGGEDIRLQLVSEVSYHCTECGERHKRTLRETH